MPTWQVGGASITRVPDDRFELLLPQDDATTSVLRSQSTWLAPHFMTDKGELRIGSSATVVRSEGTCIVVDPWLAFDGPDRSAPDAVARLERLLTALADGGCRPEDVDVVVNTHIDGVGANTLPVDAREVASFPNARYVLAVEELDELRAGRRAGAEAFEVLAREDRLDVVSSTHHVTGEVSVEPAPGHCPGHRAVTISSSGQHAVVPGHLFLHPAQVFEPGPRPGLDEDPDLAAATRRSLLERCARDRALLVGPLFAEPGGGRVVSDGERCRLVLDERPGVPGPRGRSPAGRRPGPTGSR